MPAEDFHAQVQRGKHTTFEAWQWLPLLASPFLFGFIVKIFPLDHERVVVAVLAALGAIALLGVLPMRWRRTVPVVAGGLLLALVVSIPFWALTSKGQSSGAPVQAVFSFRAAKADPEAFSKWWNFFVDEVVRTNAVIYERDPEGAPDFQGLLPFRPKPGAKVDFYKGGIAINNQGYRGDDFPREKGDIYRILTIGDSVTFGQTLFPDSRPWSAVLQDLIARNLRCSKPVQVVNGGVNGYRLRNGIDRLESDYPWLKPDMVLSYYGWSGAPDMGVNPVIAPPPAPPSGIGRPKLVWWFLENAVVSLHNEVVLGFLRLLSTTRGENTEAMMAKVRKGVLYRHYQELIEQSRRLGYVLVLLSFNTAVTPDGPEQAKAFYQGPWPGVRSIIEQMYLHNLMIQELANDSSGAHFIDTGADIYGQYDKDLYLDIVHFTTKGDALMARNVSRGILPLLLRDRDLSCRSR